MGDQVVIYGLLELQIALHLGLQNRQCAPKNVPFLFFNSSVKYQQILSNFQYTNISKKSDNGKL